MRHGSPVTTTVARPPVSTPNTRPACSVIFYALNVLMRSNPDHSTVTLRSVRRRVSAAVTIDRHLIEREPRRTGIPGKDISLLDLGSRQ